MKLSLFTVTSNLCSQHCSELPTVYDSRAIIWAWLQGQLHQQHALLYHLFQAYPVCSFSQTAVSVAQCILSRSILCFPFSSIVCRVLPGPLRQHNSAISTTPKASLQKHDGSISTTPYTEKPGCETAENYVHVCFQIFHNADIVIQQIRKYFRYVATRMQANQHSYASCNAVPLVWSLISLAPIEKKMNNNCVISNHRLEL